MVLRSVLSTLAGLAISVPIGIAQQESSRESLSPDLFAQVSEGRYRQVMHIGPGSMPGSMLVLTRHDVQEFDTAGKRVRIERFPDELWLPFPARFSATGPQRIIGVKSGLFRSWIDVLDESAKRLARLKGWQYGFVEVADVIGDAAKEILVRYEDGVAVLNESGTRLAFIRSPRYLYHFRSIQLPDSAKRAVAMWMWLDAKRGVDISVMRVDGATVAAWHENPSERLNVFSLGGEGEGLWSAVGGQFIERSITGVKRRSFDVPGMQGYRYVHGGVLSGGWKVLVGSAGGYASGSLVCVFDENGMLRGRSALPTQSWAFYVPDPTAHVFYIGAGEKVLRYDASLLRGGVPLP